MNLRTLRRLVLTLFVAAGLLAPLAASTAQETPAADPRDTVVAELTVVAPGTGPAWWKVSKGDASVWILGLPPTDIPKNTRWDQSTLRRRLKGAKLMLGVYLERSWFYELRAKTPLPSSDLAKEVSRLSPRLGRRLAQTATAEDAMNLRNLYRDRHRICLCMLGAIESLAGRARVPVVTSPAVRHQWRDKAFAPENPFARGCVQAVLTEVQTPPQQFREMARRWAKGDVAGVLATAPPTIEKECAHLWPGQRERTIAFQTSVIAQALDRPGKVIAVAGIHHLVAADGILERLRAQGFTIHDPSKPLED